MAIARHALRRAIRAPANPLDKSTVVSIYPRAFTEKKVTIQPGTFTVPAGDRKNPGILVVGTSSWWKEIDPDQPLLEIPVASIQIADSIIKDYANGLLACNMGDCMPGMFYVPGDWKIEEVLVRYGKQLDEAEVKQKKWYETLVMMADTLWARSSGNPLSISDNMRLAAQELQFTDKAWLKDFKTMLLQNCPACGQLRDAQYPVCQHCHNVINREQYEEARFTQAAQG